MDTEQRQRLEGLRDHLAAMPDDAPNFDMGAWRCGTARCAIGEGILAGILPGLELRAGHPYLYPLGHEPFYPTCGGLYGFDAVALYFGIQEFEAIDLFGDNLPGATPADIARGVTEFLESWDRQAAYYGSQQIPQS